MKYLVHFTTFGERVNHILPTINSWLQQDILPEMIIITMSSETKKLDKNNYNNISKRIMINETKQDHGASEKLLGILQFLEKNPEYKSYPVIICDDDAIYKNSVSSLYDFASEKFPDDCLTLFTREIRVKDYEHIKGVDTYLLPGCLTSSTTAKDFEMFLEKIFNECPSTFYQDDYVISYYLNKFCKIPTKSITSSVYYTCSHQIDQMHLDKRVEERKNSVINYFKRM